MTALEVLKKARAEMKPNAKAGEYDLPVILQAMHEFAALRQPRVIGSVCDFCGDTYRVQQHNVCEPCRKICGD